MANKSFGLCDTADLIFSWETDSESEDSDCDSMDDPLYAPPSARPHPPSEDDDLPQSHQNEEPPQSEDEEADEQSESEEEFLDTEDEADDAPNQTSQPRSNDEPSVWSDASSFQPKFSPSAPRESTITPELKSTSSVLEIFLKLWPMSLFIQMTYYTNQRLKLYEREKKRKIKLTNPYEMMSLIGCVFIMGYNRLPSINCYWSSKLSMGNALIKSTFSRDRFKLLFSKIYVNSPEKPSSASKTYYVEELFSCLKHTFQKVRQDSPFESIDESMTKFKGRSSIKQYLPLKPVKRGIKVWMRCDSKTGYVYDMDIYSGKEEMARQGYLGERVIKKLASSIKEKDVTLAFDRFFTSVSLMNTLQFPAIGTCLKNRKNMPKDIEKLKKGESEFQGNQHGILAVRWVDSKEVVMLTNCHDATVNQVQKKKKDGSKKAFHAQKQFFSTEK